MISAMKKMIELISVVILLAACQPTPTPSPTPTPVQVTASPVATVTPPAGMVEAQVVNVVDGDTIDVIIQGREFRLRYIGVDTPESVHPTIGEEPYGKEAAQRNRELVMGRTVYLEKDVSETDQYGRLLRYVYLPDGRMLNEVLVREGYAQVATFPPDVRYQDRFLDAQRQAREEGAGLWGRCRDGAAAPRETSPTPATSAAAGHEPCAPGQIKGNRNSGVYHAPGQRDYARTTANVECFDSEAEAQAAGYRKASR